MIGITQNSSYNDFILNVHLLHNVCMMILNKPIATKACLKAQTLKQQLLKGVQQLKKVKLTINTEERQMLLLKTRCLA